MIASTKLFFVLTGSAGAAAVGAGPVLNSDLTITALLAAGAAPAAPGLSPLVHTAPTAR